MIKKFPHTYETAKVRKRSVVMQYHAAGLKIYLV